MKKITFLLCISLFLSIGISKGQSDELVKQYRNWQLSDPDSGKTFGTAATTAYQQLLKGKTPVPITVAVIDGGTDDQHPDLKPVLWTNEKEIPGNGMDDDQNGFADDVHGWNFVGGPNGDVAFENVEITRLYRMGKKGLPEGMSWSTVKKDFKKNKKDNEKQHKLLVKIVRMMDNAKKISKGEQVLASDLEQVKVHGLMMKLIKKQFVNTLRNELSFEEMKSQMDDAMNQVSVAVKYHYNTTLDARSVVGDDPGNAREYHYGNNHIKGPDAAHGSHVAGIIAAVRGNDFGMDGVADAARIMVVRVCPDGDERDKDLANGVRYAVDNGAKIINISLGKKYSPNKDVVDEAFKYADAKGVLIVHAAGNDNQNLDEAKSFPNAVYADGSGKMKNYICVGATDSKGRAARFSNYGKNYVDLFAPGVKIYSTVPGDSCKLENGTSMASPVVAGVAALVWSYYPQLTAAQVKEAIVSSTYVISEPCRRPGRGTDMVKLSDISVTGGIVNVKGALAKAATLAGN